MGIDFKGKDSKGNKFFISLKDLKEMIK